MNVPRLETVRTVIRETAIEAMPELAPHINDEPTIIQQHLIRELGIKATARELELINGWSFENAEVSPIDALQPSEQEIKNAATLTKYERYSIVQSATWRQSKLLLSGRPDDPAQATFKDGLFLWPSGKSFNDYEHDHNDTFLAAGTKTFEANPWMDNAGDRYTKLYLPFANMRPYTPGVSPEASSMVLSAAMSGAGVRIHTVESIQWLSEHRDTKNLSSKSRADVAHDLAYLGLVFASQHFETVGESSIAKLRGSIMRLPNDRWIYVRGSAKEDPHYAEIVGRAQWYAPTLKCPVHQPTKQEPTSELEYYLHASIDAAVDYDLFG